MVWLLLTGFGSIHQGNYPLAQVSLCLSSVLCQRVFSVVPDSTLYRDDFEFAFFFSVHPYCYHNYFDFNFILHLDESEIQEAKKRKDNGKAIVEDATVLQLEPPTPLTKKLSSATLSGLYLSSLFVYFTLK